MNITKKVKETKLEKFNNVLGVLANWLEAIGFIIMVVTAFKVFFLERKVRDLQNKHLFSSRIAEHLKSLKATSFNIANLLNDFGPNKKQIRDEVNQCNQNCLNIQKKMKSGGLENLGKLIKYSTVILAKKLEDKSIPKWQIKIFKIKPLSEDDIDQYYLLLKSLIAEIDHSIKDSKKTIR